MNESCKSMPFVKCLASSGVPSQTSRMSKAEYAVTSCPPGLEHPWSKWSMSTCSWCCATMAQHKEGGWRARDERVRKRSGRREGRMQHARLRDTAQSSHERRSRATAAADIRRDYLLTYFLKKANTVTYIYPLTAPQYRDAGPPNPAQRHGVRR